MNSVGNKLYVVVRSDMSYGERASQLVHAAMRFALERPNEAIDWATASETIVLLETSCEEALHDLVEKARSVGESPHLFHEPDMDNSLTAVAVGVGAVAKKLCRGLPLAMS